MTGGSAVIRQRKDREGLQVQVYAGCDPLTGRKRWVSRQVPGKGRAAIKRARQVEAELLAQIAAGQHRGSKTKTVAELIERWLEWRLSVRPISPTTVAAYRGYIDRSILPSLGRLQVGQLDAATLTPSTRACAATAARAVGPWPPAASARSMPSFRAP
jgi:hypothetical protein